MGEWLDIAALLLGLAFGAFIILLIQGANERDEIGIKRSKRNGKEY